MTLIKFNKENRPSFPGLLDSFFGKDIFDLISNNGYNGSVPAVNIAEEKDSFQIEVAVPGLKKENFNLNVDHHVLTISANVEENKTDSNKSYRRREYSYSSFKRVFTLPESVDGAKIGAKYEDGILNITLPKKEEAKEKPARTIQIS